MIYHCELQENKKNIENPLPKETDLLKHFFEKLSLHAFGETILSSRESGCVSECAFLITYSQDCSLSSGGGGRRGEEGGGGWGWGLGGEVQGKGKPDPLLDTGGRSEI